jgi:hypothetical protein
MQAATSASIGVKQMTTLGRDPDRQWHTFRDDGDIMVPVYQWLIITGQLQMNLSFVTKLLEYQNFTV